MAKQEKVKVMVNGKLHELSPTAYEMASKYFGAVKVEDMPITKPIELTKPILIPKIKVEKPAELTEAPKLPDIIVKDAPAEVVQAKKVARKPRKK